MLKLTTDPIENTTHQHGQVRGGFLGRTTGSDDS